MDSDTGSVKVIANLESQVSPQLDVQLMAHDSHAIAELNASCLGSDGGALIDHINDHNNPHQVTWQQAGAVPYRLAQLRAVESQEIIPSFREQQALYLNNTNTGEGSRISLQQIKDMNTKIMSVDTIDDADMDKLDIDDYIYVKN